MKQLFVGIAVLFCVTHVSAQEGLVPVKVRAILVDKDLNPKPVPKLVVYIVGSSDSTAVQPKSLTTGFDGLAEAQLTPGRYRLTTPQPAEFQGKKYSWELDWDVVPPESHLDLSKDNAKVIDADVEASAVDNLGVQFQRLKNSAVTVWSEFGHGTGFFADSSGLALTNLHVVRDSDYLAVQFDANRKVAAKLLASDPQRDIAVLWVNISVFPEAVVPSIGGGPGATAVAEGDRVFTIGSPLDLRKILTSGVVSKVDAHAIISDINVNPGNSGGPLFTANGTAVGITAYREQAAEGPGITGIVPIGDALPVLEKARKETAGVAPPAATLLPVEPEEPYPLDELKEAFSRKIVDKFSMLVEPYEFGAGKYEVHVWTPPLVFLAEESEALVEAHEKYKHAKKETGKEAAPSLPPGWEQVAAHIKPVLEIVVQPKLKQGLFSKIMRSYAQAYAIPTGQANVHFKEDFYRMRLLCGDKEVQPIRPGKKFIGGGSDGAINITNEAFVGDYFYPPESISSDCARVVLEIYADKESKQATVIKTIDPKIVDDVLSDFAAYRKAQPAKPDGQPSK